MKTIAFPETSPSPWPTTRSVMRALVWGITFGVAVRAVFYLFDHHSLPAAARLALVVLPFVPALFCLRNLVRWVRGLDELQQRLQLQSFAAVFPGLLLAILGNELLCVGGFTSGVELTFVSVGVAMLVVYKGVFLWLWWRSR